MDISKMLQEIRGDCWAWTQTTRLQANQEKNGSIQEQEEGVKEERERFIKRCMSISKIGTIHH
jgi:hypothetical protein